MHRMLWACVASLTVVTSSFAVTVTDRSDLVTADARARIFTNADVFVTENLAYGDSNAASSPAPGVQSVGASGSGTLFDTATGQIPVITGVGSASAMSNLSLTATGVQYSVAGQFASNLTTGTLAGYTPNDPANPGNPVDPANTEVRAESSPGYNSGFSIITDANMAFELRITQTSSTGTVFNAGLIYRDDNGDNNQDPSEPEILPYSVIGGNEERILTGTLPASIFPYRVFFFGNTFDATTNDGESFSSGTNFTSSFIGTVPEPTSLGLLSIGAMSLLRRRR